MLCLDQDQSKILAPLYMQLCSLSDNLSGPSLLACRQEITKQSLLNAVDASISSGVLKTSCEVRTASIHYLDVSSKDISQMRLAVAYLTWKGVVFFEMHVWRDHHLVYVVKDLSQF